MLSSFISNYKSQLSNFLPESFLRKEELSLKEAIEMVQKFSENIMQENESLMVYIKKNIEMDKFRNFVRKDLEGVRRLDYDTPEKQLFEEFEGSGLKLDVFQNKLDLGKSEKLASNSEKEIGAPLKIGNASEHNRDRFGDSKDGNRSSQIELAWKKDRS